MPTCFLALGQEDLDDLIEIQTNFGCEFSKIVTDRF